LIDCTGDANLVGKLGLPRLREEQVQTGTMMHEIGDYDVSKLDADVVERRFQEAVREKNLLPGDVANPDSMARARVMDFLRGRARNRQHLQNLDGATSAGKTLANIAGRQSVLRILRFVRSLPGCENARLVRMQTETGIRESYRIVGEKTVTADDYRSGREFPDAVAFSFYPLDIHTDHGTEIRPLEDGIVPTIPLGALIAAIGDSDAGCAPGSATA
jgi:hypothetical protein